MKKIIPIMLLVVITIFSTSCMASQSRERGENVGAMNGKEKIEEAVPVETQVLKKKSVKEEVFTFGYLEPNDSYNVTPKGTGVVDTIMVSVGDYVEKGDILYQLETDNLELSQDKDLLQKNSSVNSGKQSLDVQSLSLKQRKGDLDSRKMSLETVETNYNNNLKLYEKGGISKVELDASEDSYEQAKISYEQMQLSYESTQINYDNAKNSYNDAMKNYTLAVKDYDSKLGDLIVNAPITGLVTEVDVQKDAMNPGNIGVKVIDDAIMILQVNVMEKNIHAIKMGQNVRVMLAYNDEEIEGKVTSISLTAKNGYYPVEISMSNNNKNLSSGMYAEAYIETGIKQDIYMVNKTAVIDGIEDDKSIFVVDVEQKIASKVNVVLGVESDNQIQIIGDVKVGQQVVVVGQDYLEEGQAIKMKE